MAVVPLKFRCFRCQQLLGVAPSKVGAVVSCPKCATELIVPEPMAIPTEPSSSLQFEPPQSSSRIEYKGDTGAAQGLDAGLSLELLDIRPEDIRVEPGARNALTAYPAPQPAVPPAEPEFELIVDPPVVPAAAPFPPPESPSLPPIRIEDGGRVFAARTLPARPRDIILPRTAVTAWSLFVLLALTFAFTAGLLAGHFVWKVH